MTAERVTIADVRRAGFCVKGSRYWFAAKGIDFRDFLTNGIASDDPRIAADALADRVLRTKRKGS